MANADEIRKWANGHVIITGPPNPETGRTPPALFFQLPVQPSSILGVNYERCVGEQRVIVETEIAAQLAELVDVLCQIRNALKNLPQG